MFDESIVVNDDISHALQFAAIAVVGSQALRSSAEVRPLPITIFFDPRIGENFDLQNRSSKVQITQIGALSWPFFFWSRDGSSPGIRAKNSWNFRNLEICAKSSNFGFWDWNQAQSLGFGTFGTFWKKKCAKVPIVPILKSRSTDDSYLRMLYWGATYSLDEVS